MTEIDKCWLAGVFDSRGSAYFQQTTNKTGKEAGRQRRAIIMSIQCARHPGLLDEVRRVCGGGSCYQHRLRSPGVFPRRNEAAAAFSCSARRARETLAAIVDYLRVRQAAVREVLAQDARCVDQEYFLKDRHAAR